MTPIKQKYYHTKGIKNGDCWRAAIASILELDIETFPVHEISESWPDYYTKMMILINNLGWDLSHYNCNLKDLSNPDTDDYIIAVGETERSKDIMHAVVFKNGIIHDPHPDDTGLINIQSFEKLTKINAKQSQMGRNGIQHI